MITLCLVRKKPRKHSTSAFISSESPGLASHLHTVHKLNVINLPLISILASVKILRTYLISEYPFVRVPGMRTLACLFVLMKDFLPWENFKMSKMTKFGYNSGLLVTYNNSLCSNVLASIACREVGEAKLIEDEEMRSSAVGS